MSDYTKYQILVDTPTSNPVFDFDRTAQGLSRLILNSSPQFAMAIYGSWGSGKTTLMNAIKRDIDHQNTVTAKSHAVTVDFSAWRYEREEQLIIPLLDTIREALVARAEEWESAQSVDGNATVKLKKLGESAKNTAKVIGSVMASILAGVSVKAGISDALNISFNANTALAAAARYSKKNENGEERDEGEVKPSNGINNDKLFQSVYHVCFKALQHSFKDLMSSGFGEGSRIVVFVDDLDRCLPRAVLEVLESMKLFFDLPGFVFVVGLDRKIVEKSVELHYKDLNWELDDDLHDNRAQHFGRNYLSKIFQIPYSLDNISSGQVSELMRAISDNEMLSSDQCDEIRSKIDHHVRYLFPVMDGRSVSLNPREVKVYLNAYTIQMAIRTHLNPDLILILNTLSMRVDCQKLYSALIAERELFLTALKAFLEDTDDASPIDDSGLTASDVPTDIREYLGEHGPGCFLLYPIVNDYQLEVHLRLGESARSSSGGLYLEIMPKFYAVRRRFKGTLSNGDGVSAGQISEEWMNAVKMLNDLQHSNMSYGRLFDEQIKRMLKWANAARKRVEDYSKELADYQSDPNDERRKSVDAKRDLVASELSAHLDMLYDAILKSRADSSAA